MATPAEQKALPGGDVGANNSDARKDDKDYEFHVIETEKNTFKKFLAPVEKYKNVLTDLGISVFNPATSYATKPRVSNGLYAGRIRVTLKDGDTTASLTLLCAPGKLGTAPAAIIGKKVYSFTIIGASIPRKRTLL